MWVSGCGYEATYSSFCEKGEGCDWKRDSDVKDQADM
jgi:hypothetical protein